MVHRVPQPWSVPWINPCFEESSAKDGAIYKASSHAGKFLGRGSCRLRQDVHCLNCLDNRCDVGIWIFKTKLSIEQHRKIQNHLSLEDVSLTS